MKRIISVLLLIATLLSAFSITAFASDDNAQSGDGDLGDATQGSAWYNPSQYLWKVTLFVGKSDQASKQSSLTEDFYRIGTVIIKKNDWTVPSSAKFGNGTKVDYYAGAEVTMDTTPKIISDANCPRIPVACAGNLNVVKSYFGSTGTMSTVLNAIADDNGTTKEEMLSAFSFAIGGRTKLGWDYEYIAPNATTNRVPWVIVYEPMIILNLKDKVTKLAFTATEFALCEINSWYDFNWSNGKGQNCASVIEKHLPTSVQLEENWFGYPVYAVTDDTVRWKHEDIVKGGGWGMRWLDVAVEEPEQSVIDYGCRFGAVNRTPAVGEYGTAEVNWLNYTEESATVLCELYRGDARIWYGDKTIEAGTSLKTTFGVYYSSTDEQTLTCKINYVNRYEETDPNDNSATVTVTPIRAMDLSIEAIEPNSDYRAGTTVITSYHIINESRYNVVPEQNNTVTFEAYYYNGNTKVTVSSQIWEQAVIPANDENLVYFKWTVPTNIIGKTVYCKATVNARSTIDEYSTANNTDTLTKTIASCLSSQTPDTQFEKTKPNGFTRPSAPASTAGRATWSLWIYQNGTFVKKNYGVAISAVKPNIVPDEGSPSAEYVNGYWQMRSGYGFYLNYKPTITSVSGYTMPNASAYTAVQQAYATFPEYKYSLAIDYFRTLQKSDSTWMFAPNPYADGNERLHFTPLWYPNGSYIVSVTATDVWTPAGMISTTRNSNVVRIVDSAYDDWYVGEE